MDDSPAFLAEMDLEDQQRRLDECNVEQRRFDEHNAALLATCERTRDYTTAELISMDSVDQESIRNERNEEVGSQCNRPCDQQMNNIIGFAEDKNTAVLLSSLSDDIEGFFASNASKWLL